MKKKTSLSSSDEFISTTKLLLNGYIRKQSYLSSDNFSSDLLFICQSYMGKMDNVENTMSYKFESV